MENRPNLYSDKYKAAEINAEVAHAEKPESMASQDIYPGLEDFYMSYPYGGLLGRVDE